MSGVLDKPHPRMKLGMFSCSGHLRPGFEDVLAIAGGHHKMAHTPKKKKPLAGFTVVI
jgi:hypothetical protein